MARVSIGLPVYNGESTLARAIQTHLDQTFTDFELVITDNCSTDGTEQICREFAARDERVRYLRNDENVGAAGNFQKAFHHSTGEYFRWAAHDDHIAPTYLERCVAVLDRHPDAAVVFPGMSVYRDGVKIKDNVQRIDGSTSPSAPRRFHTVIWKLKDCTSPVFGLTRRSALEKTGLVRNAPEPDRILLAELSLIGEVHQIEEILFHRGVTQGQYKRDNWAWLNPRNRGTAKRGWLRVTRHHLNAIDASAESSSMKVLMRADLVVSSLWRRPYFRVRRFFRRRWFALVRWRQALEAESRST